MSIRRSWKLLVLVCAAVAVVGYGVWASRSLAFAPQAETASDVADLEPFDIPNGDPEKLFGFIEELAQEGQNISSAAGQREHQQRTMLTAVAVADRILERKELSDEDAEKAAQLKVQGYVNLAVLTSPDPKPARQAIEKVEELAKEDRKVVSDFAKNNLQVVRIICVAGLAPKERDALVDEVLNTVKRQKFAPRALSRAQMLGETLGEIGDRDRLLDYYGNLATVMRESGIENLVAQAQQIEGQLRRMKLPGNVMELEGQTLSGEQFDWEAYRGKVVLVDYWATWCGPCRQELPNVKKNYKKYHDKGFEVVGISLDDDHAQLKAFLKDEKIPWITLFEPDEDRRGWNHPMAVHYGVSAIPMAILVDKQGKVVSLSARGPELSRLLSELLGDKK